MANLKKTIRPEEWAIIKAEAVDPRCSLSRLYDIISNKRTDDGIKDHLNRHWFLGFMKSVCNCRDGKIGTKFHIPASALNPDDNKPLEETPSVTSENVPEESISGPLTAAGGNTESASDLLTQKTLFCLQWLYNHEKTEVFSRLWTEGGYKKKMCTDAASELLNLGVISKKNPKRFEPFDWDQILKDFPEVANIPEEHSEWKAKQSHSLVEASKAEPKKEETPNEDPLKAKLELWLMEEDHVCGEFTQKELSEELIKLHAKNPYAAAAAYIAKWAAEARIQPVPGTSAYRIYNYSHGRTNEVVTPSITPMENLRRSLGFPSSSTESRRMPENAKALVVHMENGKDIEIRNNSNSKLRLTVENDKVILTILP